MDNIIVTTIKSWNIENFYKLKKRFKNKYNFILITKKDDLTFEYIKTYNPIYIFFPHWSWYIDEKIYNNYKCIVFHETDLPYGRGGSPLQNLIIRGIKTTKISAIKVQKEIDSGDIYLKEDLDISFGSAQEIFEKASSCIFGKMIPALLDRKCIPQKQKGEVVLFKRREALQSDMISEKIDNLEKLYDFIRMLDGEDYPKAFITKGNMKIEFSNAKIVDNKIVGKFEVINE